ncbi:CDGSH iron-sulfur domain-containing protein [Perlabentimonas gracilis]|uniref:CDGSH iron-sulfur domain-containing protein n=1 Tax=Perlabentimonas gracilis TaxID=2715279 RepID=UPI001C62FA4C|nr:CDGSH iron-sulfur domain-containing protein [Perlabentimonas gracilis]
MNSKNQDKIKGTEVRINRNGPIKVMGKFTLTSVSGDTITPEGTDTIYLCACGLSENKPFCDGSHNK